MFHTFDGFESQGANTNQNRERHESVGRRITTLRACTSCRHRKIKCDGKKPCEACQWYKKADQCQYSDPRPSRRHVEKLSSTLDEYRGVFEKLFPNQSPESLATLPRDKLLKLAGETTSHPQTQTQGHACQSQHPVSPASAEAHVSPLSSADGNLESLQTMPEESSESRDSISSDIVNGVSDDVNALSLTSKQPSSYLGVSSIHAVLKVIVWLDPGCVSYFSSSPERPQRALSAQEATSRQPPSWQSRILLPSPVTPPQANVHLTEVQLIEAYFTYFQPFIPMIDEQSFRETYLSGRRKDDRWLGLLFIILALGSIAATTSDDLSHHMYYIRSKSHLSLESLGSSHLETIQTLGLMGGYYLHYVSQPNLAYSLMGAALRMAAALGLHKEFTDNNYSAARHKMLSMDLKRRVWWSLFCMDTWGSGTLGRPSMGRYGPTITVKLPQCGPNENILSILPLLENIHFCKISTQVQEALAVAPLVKYPEMSSLDQQLLDWYENLPAIMKDHQPCSESIAMARMITRWRYHNQRILLNRPMLLSYSMRRVPYIALRSEERIAIEKCRALAQETIRDISATSLLNQMTGWHGVWLIFQATMVPLLGLFLKDSTSSDPCASVESCQAQVEQAMLALARMTRWSPTAKRTLDVVSRIYDASKRGADAQTREPNDIRNDSRNVSEPNAPPLMFCGGVVGLSSVQNDLRRHLTAQNENGLFPDPSTSIPLLDDFVNQNMWDYLSWSDNSLWPGLADSENRIDTMMFFGMDENNLLNKFGDGNQGNSPFFSRIQVPSYLDNDAHSAYY